MIICKKLFGGRMPERIKDPEHAVIVIFQYGKTDLQPIIDLEDELEQAINKARAGKFNDTDIAADSSDGYFYMYGPDADQLFSAVRHILESSNYMNGATVRLRYGPPEVGVKEKEVKIGS